MKRDQHRIGGLLGFLALPCAVEVVTRVKESTQNAGQKQNLKRNTIPMPNSMTTQEIFDSTLPNTQPRPVHSNCLASHPKAPSRARSSVDCQRYCQLVKKKTAAKSSKTFLAEINDCVVHVCQDTTNPDKLVDNIEIEKACFC